MFVSTVDPKYCAMCHIYACLASRIEIFARQYFHPARSTELYGEYLVLTATVCYNDDSKTKNNKQKFAQAEKCKLVQPNMKMFL